MERQGYALSLTKITDDIAGRRPFAARPWSRARWSANTGSASTSRAPARSSALAVIDAEEQTSDSAGPDLQRAGGGDGQQQHPASRQYGALGRCQRRQQSRLRAAGSQQRLP